MRSATAFVGLGVLIIILSAWVINENFTKVPDTSNSMAGTLTLSSSAFEHQGMIPAKYTCDGDDMSPPLSWSGAPEGTKSFALIADDPDAPRGTWDHWVLFNMPPTLSSVEEGQNPEGVVGRNSSQRKEYGSPCPPSGTHRYFFRLYALDTQLPLEEGATKKEVLAAMEGHILASTELMGRYQRQ